MCMHPSVYTFKREYLRPFGQLQPNFISNSIGVGKRLHKVLGQIGSELWLPWQKNQEVFFMVCQILACLCVYINFPSQYLVCCYSIKGDKKISSEALEI